MTAGTFYCDRCHVRLEMWATGFRHGNAGGDGADLDAMHDPEPVFRTPEEIWANHPANPMRSGDAVKG